MDNERLLILRLLKEGKLTVEEANRLIKYIEQRKLKKRIKNKFYALIKNIEKLIQDFGNEIESTRRNVEPKCIITSKILKKKLNNLIKRLSGEF